MKNLRAFDLLILGKGRFREQGHGRAQTEQGSTNLLIDRLQSITKAKEGRKQR